MTITQTFKNDLIVMIIMKVSAVMAVVIASILCLLSFNVFTLCKSTNAIDFLKVADSKADSFIFENGYGVLTFGRDKVYLSIGKNIFGKEKTYMGVKLFEKDGYAEAVLNGITIFGKESLVKKVIRDVFSGHNVYNYLENLGLKEFSKVVKIYLLKSNYCPFSNNTFVIVVEKTDKKTNNQYIALVYDHGWKKFRIKDVRTMYHVKRVLYFNVTFNFSSFRSSSLISTP